MTIVGTRPEIIRLSEVIKRCDKYFEQILVHTGQNYDYALGDIFFKDLALRQADHHLEVVGENLGETMGNIISQTYNLMVEEKPDALLVLGDTNSSLAAISAKRLHIPIFHMEAGNRCFDENLPEETNRRIVDHIADVNICYSEHARRYLNAEGVTKQRTFVSGSPMAEVLEANIEQIKSSKIVESLGLEKGRYILLSAHREENIDSEQNFLSLMEAVNAIAQRYDMPILYSCHPRARKIIEKRNFQFDSRVMQHEPLGFHDYNNLQINAMCTISDSGTLPEESAYYASAGMPIAAVSIRTSTERPEAMENSSFILAGITQQEVLQAVECAVKMHQNGDYPAEVSAYAHRDVSTKIVKLIQSYTGVVNRDVWRKN